MPTSKVIYIAAIATILMLVIGGFIYWIKQPSYFEMNGNVVEVKDSSIVFSGGFNVKQDRGVSAENFEVSVDSNTKIIRQYFVLPNDGLMFKMDDLPKEEAAADLSTMKSDAARTTLGIAITLQRNIFGKAKMTAAEIKYISPKFQ